MAETFDKNMIDKDEYPQTAEIERRCVNIVADLFHAPADGDAVGAVDHRLQRGGDARRPGHEVAAGASAARPPATRPTSRTSSSARTSRWSGRSSAATGTSSLATSRCTEDRYVIDPEDVMTRVDENTIGVVADPRHHLHRASTSRSRRSTTALDDLQRRDRHSTSRSTSTRPAAGSSPRSSTPTSSGTSACRR